MSGGSGGPFDFSCNVTHVETIPTPNFVTDAQAAQLIASGQIRGLKKFNRNFFGSGKVIMPDGVEIQHWGFDDGSDTKPLPSPQIRVMEGEVAQVKLTTGKSKEEAIRGLYLSALSRPPRPAEMQRMMTHLETTPMPGQGYRDIYWALLNSAEFVLNR